MIAMDAKELRSSSSLSASVSDGNTKYSHGSPSLPSNRNKTYQDIGSISMGKGDVTAARPCAIIGPDRVVPPTSNDAYHKTTAAEPWSGPNNLFSHPPEYPHKISEYQPIRNISPRQTFQENMQRIMVPPTYSSVKNSEDSNIKNAKLLPSEAQYCDVPYNVNPVTNEHKSVRNTDIPLSSVNPHYARNVPYGWPTGVNVRPLRPYGAPEYYQYPEYPSCAGPRSMPIIRPHRVLHEENSQTYPERMYQEANIRFKPNPNVKERHHQVRYDYISNYQNTFHPPTPYPPQKYDLQKMMHPHPYPYPQATIKYLDRRFPEPMIDSYHRSTIQQTNYNPPFQSQMIPPPYGTSGNCMQNKSYTDITKSINTNKLPFENNNKIYLDLESTRPKGYPGPENYYFNEINHHQSMRSEILLPNPSNMHLVSQNPHYRKDNVNSMKSFDYHPRFRSLDPSLHLNNTIPRAPLHFSPNTIAISPSDSNTSNDTIHTLGASQEDCGYVSQSSTTSVRSLDSGNKPYGLMYKRHELNNYRNASNAPPDHNTNNNSNTSDKKDLNVRQFLQMWNEGDDEVNNSNTEATTQKHTNGLTVKSDSNNSQEQLYVLGLVNVPNEELAKYDHIQKISKLPENIKGYNSIEILNQFEELVECPNINRFHPKPLPTRDYSAPKHLIDREKMTTLPRPVSPLDVEAKISQSVIHKEVGCNFEIKPCSPPMLNVEVAASVQNILNERIIEKVINPVIPKSPILPKMDENKGQNLKQDANKVTSCNLLNNHQYTSSNSGETTKTNNNYCLQDLESSSGVCLASLPRLDNDIELSFPEVNQQFINANKNEPVNISILKELPKLDTNLPDSKSVDNNNWNPNSILSSQLPPISTPEKEFCKLSKFRKAKKCETTKAVMSIINQQRIDSVIIKNPENVKFQEEINEKPLMNTISEYGENNIEAESCLSSEAQFACKENNVITSIETALDFSLNKIEDNTYTNSQNVNNNLISDLHVDRNLNSISNTMPDSNLMLNELSQADDLPHKSVKHSEVTKLSIIKEDVIDKKVHLRESNKLTSEYEYLHEHISKPGSNIEYNSKLNAKIPELNALSNIKSCTNKFSEENITLDLHDDGNSNSISNAIPDSHLMLNELSQADNLPHKSMKHSEITKHSIFKEDEIDKKVHLRESNKVTSEYEYLHEDILKPGSNIEYNSKLITETPELNALSNIESCTSKFSEENVDKNINSIIKNTIFPQNEEYYKKNEKENHIQKNEPCEVNKSCTELRAAEVTNSLDAAPLKAISNNESNISNVSVITQVASKDDSKNVSPQEVLNSDETSSLLQKDQEIENECKSDDESNLTSNKKYVDSIETESLDSGCLLITSVQEKKLKKKVDEIENLNNHEEQFNKSNNQEGIIDTNKTRNIIFEPLLDSEISNEKNTEIRQDEVSFLHKSEVKNEQDFILDSKENINVSLVSDVITSKKSDSEFGVEQNNLNRNGELATSISCAEKNDDICIKKVDDNNVLLDDKKVMINNDNIVNNKIMDANLCKKVNKNIQKELYSPWIQKLIFNNVGPCKSPTIQIQSIHKKCAAVNENILSENNISNVTSGNRKIEMSENSVKIDEEILDHNYKNTDCLISELQYHTEENPNNDTSVKTDDKNEELKKSIASGKACCSIIPKKILKRSLSESALDGYEDSQSIKSFQAKRKRNEQEDVLQSQIITENFCNIIHSNRRNSISTVYNEDNIFILIDNNFIIANDEKLCLADISEDCQNETQDDVDVAGNLPNESAITISNEISESSSSIHTNEHTIEESWVEDVACVETVFNDDVAEDVIIDLPTSPKIDNHFDNENNNESHIFFDSDHLDKMKDIYGTMYNDNAHLLETLYRTPQMDVNHALVSIESHKTEDFFQYSANNREHNNASVVQKKYESMEINKLPEETQHTSDIHANQDGYKDLEENEKILNSIHSNESSSDSFTLNLNNEDMSHFSYSSSPEVSSTTSEDRNSTILLKITKYNGSRISQINDYCSNTSNKSYKLTEENKYCNYSSSRTLITKAAQKYIPPLKETIRDLKIKLPLPQHRLDKLKKLKISQIKPKKDLMPKIENFITKSEIRVINSKSIPKKQKPKFEDVLKSIDENQFKINKKIKKGKNSIPKVIIKKAENGAHYASNKSTNNIKESYNPDLTGRKWQPWVFLEKDSFIDKMASKKKTKAVYCHRKNTYVIADKFKKYKSVYNANFIISQPKSENTTQGNLKYTIRLKPN